MMKFSIRLPEEDHLKLKYEAKKKNVSVAQLIRDLVNKL